MIIKFKLFESKDKNKIIYSCSDFKVTEDFTFETMFLASNFLSQLPEIIKHNLPALNDDNFKNIKISDENKRLFILHSIELYDKKIENIKEYHTGLIGNFLISDDDDNFLMNKKHHDFVKNINSDVYIQLTLKYYPLIEEIIKNSETIGDVIIEYKKLILEINKDLELFTQLNKYNL